MARIRAFAAGTTGIWHDFFQFLRRPRPIAPMGVGAAGAWRVGAALLPLYAMGVLLAGVAIAAWGKRFGLGNAHAFQAIPHMLLAPVVVLIAPPIEEALFRGWLTGRPRALWLLGCAVVVAILALLAGAFPVAAAAIPVNGRRLFVVAMLLIAGVGWFRLRWRPGNALAPRFAAAFYTSAALFALMHTFNFSPHPGWVVLPMVLPQLWQALCFGYLRMRVGLAASIGLHALNNAVAIALLQAGDWH